MTKTAKQSDIVSHIAGFTALRDADLLELSLLKSIYTTLRPVSVSLVSLDSSNLILKRIDYSSVQYGHVTVKVPADERLLAASEQLDKTNKEFTSLVFDNITYTLFLLSQTRRVSHYISIEAGGNSVTQADSQQIIGMLKVFQNFRSLLREAQTDELTGLPNRKAFNEVFVKLRESLLPTPEIIEDDKRDTNKDASFWLALVDLDNFKQVNDNHGHLIGDEVLVRASQTMQSALREADMVFRYGGEEFALVISASDQDEVAGLLERVRESIEKLDIPIIGKVTASIGAVEVQNDIFHLTLIENADKALYASKENGKNQITFAEDIIVPQHNDSEGDIELF